MTPEELPAKLTALISKWEQETIEFKQAGNDFSTDKIGHYFSALSNEANLHESEEAWLVFGIDNRSRSIVGSNYREDEERLQTLKQQIAENTEPSISFRGVHALETERGRVVMLEIPSAPRGIPIAWKGHYYARNGESLAPLGLAKLDEIRGQTLQTDWSAHIVKDATFHDLDPEAIARAKSNFIKKHGNRIPAKEIEAWSDLQFLDKARITINGQITRAALLLLGSSESSHLLLPHPAQLTWKLTGHETAYEHFSPPFILSSSSLYQRIRNIQIRILPHNELLAVEVAKYDQKMVLEALHNCIAHQDYTKNSRIIVTESPHTLVFENVGTFIDGCPDDYISGNRTPRRYRNTFMARAMTELNMIDTMGYGIHQLHTSQAARFLPMPDFEITPNSEVKLTIYGSVVDEAYSQALMLHADLPLCDILALDRVQKHHPINDATIKRLRKQNLIEGRKPNFRVSSEIAQATAQKGQYIKTRGLDDAYYKTLILELIQQFGSASRSDIDDLLTDKLSDLLDEPQKKNKISNLITSLRRNGKIINKGSDTKSEWHLI